MPGVSRMRTTWSRSGWVRTLARPTRADQAGAEVLVAIHARPTLSARVVEVDEPQPPEADRLVELGDEGVDAGGLVHRVAGGPEVGDIEAPGEPVGVDAGPDDRRLDPGELLDARADAGAAARPVLEHNEDAGGRRAHVREHPAQPFAEPADARLEARAAMRPEVDVDDRRVPRGGDAQLVGQDGRWSARGRPDRGRRG